MTLRLPREWPQIKTHMPYVLACWPQTLHLPPLSCMPSPRDRLAFLSPACIFLPSFPHPSLPPLTYLPFLSCLPSTLSLSLASPVFRSLYSPYSTFSLPCLKLTSLLPFYFLPAPTPSLSSSFHFHVPSIFLPTLPFLISSHVFPSVSPPSLPFPPFLLKDVV